MDERELRIFKLAQGFLSQLAQSRIVDETDIDSNFLFRFDPVWTRRLREIRRMMWGLFVEEKDIPFPSEEGARLLVHLEQNAGISVGINLSEEVSALVIDPPNRKYRLLNSNLKQEQEQGVRSLVQGEDITPFQQLHEQVWAEANQTSKIWIELERLAKGFHVIPHTEEEERRFPLEEIKANFRNFINWVIWEHMTPAFLWSKTRLIEYEINGKSYRTIRPYPWSEKDPERTPNLKLPTRIRTWAIYYLTRRGGGVRTQQAALSLWNEHFTPYSLTDVGNYRHELGRLFHKAQKRVNIHTKTDSR